MSYLTTNLFDELTADGNTAALALAREANTVDVYLQEGANDGAGTLKMQSSHDSGTTWVDVPSASWTTGDGLLGQYTAFGSQIRFNLNGSTTPSGMIVQVSAKGVSPINVFEQKVTANGTWEFNLPAKPDTVAFRAAGTWDSASAKIEHSPDGGTTWYDINTAITADGGNDATNTANSTLFRLNVTSIVTLADLDVAVYAY